MLLALTHLLLQHVNHSLNLLDGRLTWQPGLQVTRSDQRAGWTLRGRALDEIEASRPISSQWRKPRHIRWLELCWCGRGIWMAWWLLLLLLWLLLWLVLPWA